MSEPLVVTRNKESGTLFGPLTVEELLLTIQDSLPAEDVYLEEQTEQGVFLRKVGFLQVEFHYDQPSVPALLCVAQESGP